MRRCRAILFDLDDTLVSTSRIDRAAILSAARVVGRRAEQIAAVAAAFAVGLKARPFPPPDAELTVPAWRTMLWERAIAESGVDVGLDGALDAAVRAHDHWNAERLDNFRFDKSVSAMVRRLQGAGYVTGILTNGHPVVQRGKAEACEAAWLFGGTDRVVLAGEYPEQKPAASVFYAACEALGTAAEHTVMVGDSLTHDIAGGINAGMLATVWVSDVDGTRRRVTEGDPSPTYTVGSVLELEPILEEIG